MIKPRTAYGSTGGGKGIRERNRQKILFFCLTNPMSCHKIKNDVEVGKGAYYVFYIDI